MSIYTRARAEDVRALAGAIVLGSSVGLALGGACLLGGPPRPAATPAPAAGGALQASASPSAGGSGVQRLAATLRERFRLDAPAPPPAAPFAFAKVAQTPSDLNCLAETVYFEARGESVDGQRAVAQVVLNRVRHPAFPKTVCGVVHQRTAAGCQFAFACSSREAATGSAAWRHAQSIAAAALHGAVMAAVGDATHFQTARSGPFAGLLKVAQIGAHVFYRFAGHGGAPGMFHGTPVPSNAPTPIEVARADPPTAVGVRGDAPAAAQTTPAASSPPLAAAPSIRTVVAPVKLSTGTPVTAPAAVHLIGAPAASGAIPAATKPTAPATPKLTGAAPTLAIAQS